MSSKVCVRSTSLPRQAGRVVFGEWAKDKGEKKMNVPTCCHAEWGNVRVHIFVIGSFCVDTRLNYVSYSEYSPQPPLELVALYLNYKLDTKVHDDRDQLTISQTEVWNLHPVSVSGTHICWKSVVGNDGETK